VLSAVVSDLEMSVTIGPKWVFLPTHHDGNMMLLKLKGGRHLAGCVGSYTPALGFAGVLNSRTGLNTGLASSHAARVPCDVMVRRSGCA